MKRFSMIVFVLYCRTFCVQPELNASQLKTTVCTLVSNPATFANRVVRVRGIVQSSLEHTRISDESCDTSSVTLWIPHTSDKNQDVQRLRERLRQAFTSRHLKSRVRATIVGKYLREDNRPVLKVESVENSVLEERD